MWIHRARTGNAREPEVIPDCYKEPVFIFHSLARGLKRPESRIFRVTSAVEFPVISAGSYFLCISFFFCIFVLFFPPHCGKGIIRAISQRHRQFVPNARRGRGRMTTRRVTIVAAVGLQIPAPASAKTDLNVFNFLVQTQVSPLPNVSRRSPHDLSGNVSSCTVSLCRVNVSADARLKGWVPIPCALVKATGKLPGLLRWNPTGVTNVCHCFALYERDDKQTVRLKFVFFF